MYEGLDTVNSMNSMDAGAAAGLAAFGIVTWLIFIAVYVLLIIANWKIFTKAGEAGWKSLIPIYNLVVLFKIIGLSPWLLLLFLASWIPFVGWIVVAVLEILTMVKLSQAFGHGAGFAIGLIFLPNIFTLILGFGSSEYVLNKTASAE